MRVELEVAMGVDLLSTIFAEWLWDEDRQAAVQRMVPRFFEALQRLQEATPELRRIELLARRRALKAEEAGLPCRLTSIVGLPSNVDWDRGFFLLLNVEALDDALRPCREDWAHYDCWGVRYSFNRLQREQTLRKQARDWLERRNATGTIDSIVLAVLRRSGIADADLLREIDGAGTQVRVLTPDGTRIDLRWRHGVLEGRVTIGPGLVWESGTVSIANAPRRFTKRDVGRRLVDVVPHPIFPEGIEIHAASGGRGGVATMKCSRYIDLFRSGDDRFFEDPTRKRSV